MEGNLHAFPGASQPFGASAGNYRVMGGMLWIDAIEALIPISGGMIEAQA